MQSGTGVVQSGTGRALDVLGCFTSARPCLRLSEISRLAGLPLTTAHRQVGELLRWGALERLADGSYVVGLRLWEVGALAPRGIDLREAAQPYLQDLYEATHQNVQLGVLDATEVLYLERITGRQSVHVITRPGARLAAHATATGRVLLAHSPRELVDEVLAGPLHAYTDRTVTDPARIRRLLADCRGRGYALSERQIELIASSVAAPVRDAAGRVVAAVSVVVPVTLPVGSTRLGAVVPAVVATARGISRALGQPL